MLKNFFVVAYRNLLRNKRFSLINIIGLSIGIGSAMLILLWVQNELSYDNFYINKHRLYQSWNRDRSNEGINVWDNTPKALGPGLKKEYPDIEQATRVNWTATILFDVGDKKLNVAGTMVDPDFLTMFRFPFLKGNMNTALNEPTNMVITEGLSKRLFGKEDGIGKTIKLDNKYNFTVSAIMKDLPNNTQFDFEYLLPWSYMRTINQDDSSWGNNSTHNYVLLREGANIESVNQKIQNVIINHGEKDWTTKSFLYPVSKLRLHSSFENGIPKGGKIKSVRVLSLIAAFILLIACINFMNMSTARSEKRAREVGIRKVVGARKGSLILQFIGESIMITLLAGILALILVQIALPGFNILTKKHLVLEYANPSFWLAFIGFIVFTGIIAGSYPAFFLSSFRPVMILKGTFKKMNVQVTPRKVLVVLQFTFAIILIVSTIVIKKQVKYARERESGYDKNQLVYTFITGDMMKNYELIRNELLSKGVASSVSKSSAPLTESWSSGGGDWEGKDPNDRTNLNYFSTDANITKTGGMQIIQGRDIDVTKYPTDSNAALLNESAVKVMGFKNPIGQVINRGSWGTDWHVIGVVRNFILQSPYAPIEPMVIQGPKAGWFNVIHMRLNKASSTVQNLASAEQIFKQYNPNYPFEYHFIDDQYAKKFGDEQTTATLSALFAMLTIFISCLGLFGLAAYMAENRIKEIGVRKVLGASVRSIVTLLSKDFMKLVIISIIIASPIAWWSMNKWLSSYDYRIAISWWIFLIAGLVAIFIALFTVSFQTVKAGLTNPVKNLRTE